MFAGLRTRLLLAVLIPTLCMAALVAWEAFRQRRVEVEQAIEAAQRLATNAALDFEQLIQRTRSVLLILSRTEAVVQRQADACTRFVRVLAPSFLHVHNINVARPDGQVFCSALPLVRELNIATTESFRRALATKAFAVSEYSVARIDGHPVLFTSFPVLDGDGEVTAVVTATLDLEWLASIVARRSLPDGGTLTLLDRGGTIVARQPDALDWLGISVDGRPGYEAWASGREYGEGRDVDGMDALMAIKPVLEVPKPAELRVVVAVPKAPILQHAIDGLLRNLGLLGLIAALALGLALSFGERAIVRPVKLLASATRRLAGGDFSARAPVASGVAQLRQLARSFNAMVDELQRWQARTEAANADLRAKEQEARNAASRLRENADHLRELSRRLLDVEEVERRTISRELHDSIGQNLAVANITLTVMRQTLPPDAPAAVLTQLADTQKLLEQTGAQVRNVLADLRPPGLDDYGLDAALRLHAEASTQRYGRAVEYAGDPRLPRLPATTEAALFRIAQEAIHNAARHADAGVIRVGLTFGDHGKTGVLTITDDGCGFAPAAGPEIDPGLGLSTMRERAEAIGAAFRLTSEPGRGTRIEVTW